jgi:CheY-like chemotaxis protein
MKQILVVDDEPRIAELCRDYLERAGFKVTQAANGADALALARTKRPDLVVLDGRADVIRAGDVIIDVTDAGQNRQPAGRSHLHRVRTARHADAVARTSVHSRPVARRDSRRTSRIVRPRHRRAHQESSAQART